MDPSIVFPSFSPYHIAFVTRELEAGMTSFDRLYGHPEFTVMRNAEIQTPRGVAIIDFALADMNGLRIEVIQPCGGDDGVYREALPAHIGATRMHHVACRIHSRPDWDRVTETIAAHRLATPIRGESAYEGNLFRYVYVDLREQLGHYLEFVYEEPYATGAHDASSLGTSKRSK